MKRLFSLLVAVVIMATSFTLSAQSLVGSWSSSPGSQIAMLEAAGSKLNDVRATQRFNEDGTYDIYCYIDLSINLQGIQMYTVMEYTQNGTWHYADNILSCTYDNFDIKELDVRFDDPSLDMFKDDFAEGFKGAFEQFLGTELSYDVTFTNDNEATLKIDTELMPYEFTITRLE